MADESEPRLSLFRRLIREVNQHLAVPFPISDRKPVLPDFYQVGHVRVKLAREGGYGFGRLEGGDHRVVVSVSEEPESGYPRWSRAAWMKWDVANRAPRRLAEKIEAARAAIEAKAEAIARGKAEQRALDAESVQLLGFPLPGGRWAVDGSDPLDVQAYRQPDGQVRFVVDVTHARGLTAEDVQILRRLIPATPRA